MNAIQTDIFGMDQAVKAPRKRRTVISENKTELSISPQEQFLLKVERALGLQRSKTKTGYVLDSRGLPLLRVSKTKTFRGTHKASELIGLTKEAMIILMQNKALTALTLLFEDREHERLLFEGLALLTLRLRKMRDEECPHAITHAFLEHYAQQDFMSNERTGETLRNNHKRAGAEARRRAAGIKPRNFRSVKAVNGEGMETPALKAESSKPHIISVERLLSVINTSSASAEEEDEL